MPSPCCPRTPQEAGCTTVEALKQAAVARPHLRPCPRYRGSRGTMLWIYRTHCSSCPRNEEAKGEGRDG